MLAKMKDIKNMIKKKRKMKNKKEKIKKHLEL